MKRTIFFFLVLLFPFFACSVPVKINNLDEYYTSSPNLPKKFNVGVVFTGNGVVSEKLVDEIVANLRGSGSYDVTYPMNASKKYDAVIEINPQVKYDGSVGNFFISFPGFLIFMPGWNGYKYYVNIDTKVSIKKGTNTRDKNIDTYYNLNHSEFDRTWTQGADWLISFGAASLIGGFLYTRFDSDIQGETMRLLSSPYSKYISNKIGLELTALE